MNPYQPRKVSDHDNLIRKYDNLAQTCSITAWTLLGAAVVGGIVLVGLVYLIR